MQNDMGQATVEKLKQFVARIERLEAEKDEIAADLREVYAEVKAFGLDVKIMRELIKKRKKDRGELAEEEALLDVYETALDDGSISEVTLTKVIRMPGV